MPEILDEADGSQDALIVKVEGGVQITVLRYGVMAHLLHHVGSLVRPPREQIGLPGGLELVVLGEPPGVRDVDLGDHRLGVLLLCH